MTEQNQQLQINSLPGRRRNKDLPRLGGGFRSNIAAGGAGVVPLPVLLVVFAGGGGFPMAVHVSSNLPSALFALFIVSGDKP